MLKKIITNQMNFPFSEHSRQEEHMKEQSHPSFVKTK